MLSGCLLIRCVLRGGIEKLHGKGVLLPAFGSPDKRARMFSSVLIRSMVGVVPRRDTARCIPMSAILGPGDTSRLMGLDWG